MDTLQPNVRTRIERLRQAMQRHQLAAYIVPSADPHLSEYLPARWQGREWLSGFTGSVGLLIVTPDFAGLWADSRYWTQAAAELEGSGIALMKTPAANSVQYIDWLAENLPAEGVVGVDGAVLSLASSRLMEQAFKAKRITLKTSVDLLDEVWTDRQPLPTPPIFEHPAEFTPESRAQKLGRIREAMRKQGAQWHFVSTLDDIAWIFNLRGADVNFNPVFVAHALIGPDQATLFMDEGKVPQPVAQALAADNVAVAPYAQAPSALAALPATDTLLVDPRRITLGLRQSAPAKMRVVEAVNPSTFAKSQKLPAEAAHVRTAMEQDGAALCEFFAWFEQALGHETITELTIDEQITAARARRPHFVSPSFATIAGFNGNGAMPHYRATLASHQTIAGNGLLLIDSGAQYLNGTTDITRVIPVGDTTPAQRRDFTLVLKSVIALSQVHFPRGVRSPMLDVLARAPLWEAGIDYGHGTGHGVGYFLNVHEGPQSISHHAAPEPHTAMEIGMITSIEPGIYRTGQWGVRIENLVLNQPCETTEFGEFLHFETLTLCPIDTRCVERSMLREDEIAWLNRYHAVVRERLTPHVSGDAKAWLETRTLAI